MALQTSYAAVLGPDGVIHLCGRLNWGQEGANLSVQVMPRSLAHLLDLASRYNIRQLWLWGDGTYWANTIEHTLGPWTVTPAQRSWWQTGKRSTLDGQDLEIDLVCLAWDSDSTGWHSLKQARSALELAQALTIIEAGADARLNYGPGATGNKWLRSLHRGMKLQPITPPPPALVLRVAALPHHVPLSCRPPQRVYGWSIP